MKAEYKWDALATYNSEKARGIVHTAEWVAEMERQQAAFIAERLDEANRKGWIVVGPQRA